MERYSPFSKEVGYVYRPEIRNYCREIPFDPPERYPELPFITRINRENKIYPMIRTLFEQIGMDKENIGTSRWNPFRTLVKPGSNVLIKPNLVTHNHYLGEKALYGSIIHGSFIRPIIDYVYLALNGKGSIIIADNPIEAADFTSLMEFTGIYSMIERLRKDGYDSLKVIDLRPKVLREDKNGEFYYGDLPGDPLGYASIDLGKNSLFSAFDLNPLVHYYTLSDMSVDHFDPKYSSESATDKYHNKRSHSYLVSGSVLNADVVISVAKMKTHCKAGVTLTLKNIIGAVYQKDCMPHHRPGLPPLGDAFPQLPSPYFVFSRRFYHKLQRLGLVNFVFNFRNFKNYFQKKRKSLNQPIEHGNWKGNDTIWRTILDLNRIVLYADKKGIMRDSIQRNYFALLDGIIAQQGEGPKDGEPLTASIIFGGFNPVLVDALAVKSMGIDYHLIKSISRAGEIEKWRLFPDNSVDLSFSNYSIPAFAFKLPKGWS